MSRKTRSVGLDLAKINTRSKEEMSSVDQSSDERDEGPAMSDSSPMPYDSEGLYKKVSITTVDDLQLPLEPQNRVISKSMIQVDSTPKLQVQDKIQADQLPKPDVQMNKDTAPEPLVTQQVTIGKADDIPNFSGKSIDFEQQLKAFKERNEINLPFTLTQVEDSMFIDQYHVATLEYHYYQKDCLYHELEICEEYINPQGKLCSMDGKEALHKLGTQDYQNDPEKIHPMSTFARENISNYYDSKEDVIKHQRSLPENERQLFSVDDQNNELNENPGSDAADMMPRKKPPKSRSASLSRQRRSTSRQKSPMSSQSLSRKRSPSQSKNVVEPLTFRENKDTNDQLIEGIICLYKVSPQGGLQRSHQASVNIPGRKFFKSENGNMVLTRSKDKTMLSLTNFDKFDYKGQYFKIQAWNINLKPINFTPDHFKGLHKALNRYYKENMRSFDKLVELAFLNGGKYVQLIYIESKKRPLSEQQEYEFLIKKQEAEKYKNVNPESEVRILSQMENIAFENRRLPRKAKKYVFFEVSTGHIVFKYGGIQTPFMTTNNSGSQIKVYELGCLVKEVREEEFKTKLCFFFCGDFMSQEIKEHQMTLKWAWNFVSIDMKTLFGKQSQGEKTHYIHHQIEHVISDCECYCECHGYLGYYPFDQNWIEKQKFNWEINTQIANSRRFNQISMINQPVDRAEYATATIYVHGSKYNHLLQLEDIRKKSYHIGVPLYKNLPNDAIVNHTRNYNIKEHIFYDQKKGNVIKTFCVKMDGTQQKIRVIHPKLNLNNQVSQHDMWVHHKKNFVTGQVEDIYQSMHVEAGDQTGILQTILPQSLRSLNSNDTDDIIERKTSMYYQQIADMPIIAQNLGINKIILQNIHQTQQQRQYILNLQDDESFVCWLQFNNFQDIGMYPTNLRIECCSHFAFMTTDPSNRNPQKNQIHIIFIDPFYPETQVAHFRSSSYYDNEIFLTNDTVIRSIVQSTWVSKRDESFNTYIWTQFSQALVRSKVLNVERGELVDSDGLDESGGEEDDIKEITGGKYFEQVHMVQNDSNFIYYVIRHNGMCHIMEGNPRDPELANHYSIFQSRAKKCLAFDVDGQNTFYLMDQDFVVKKFTRSTSNRSLIIQKETTIKQIFTPEFNVNDFNSVMISDKYVIQGNTIFYLYETGDDEFPEGILEAEDIVVENRSEPKSNHIHGPLPIQGSKRLFNVYQVDKFKSHITITLRPDATCYTVINDFQNLCDMSTFLDNGYILIKCRRRFMVFDSCGRFLDEIYFNDEKLNDQMQIKINDKGKKKSKQLAIEKQPTEDLSKEQLGLNKLIRRRKDDAIVDFSGNCYNFKPIPGAPPLNAMNKLDICNMSFNNKWYLFYNRMEKQFFIYQLTTIQPGPDNPQQKYSFDLTYQLDTQDNFMFKHMSSIGVCPIAYFRENKSQINIDDKANVKLVFVENLPIADVKSEGSADDDTRHIQCRILGSIFTPVEGELKMASQCFIQTFDFFRDAQEDIADIVKENKHALDRKLKQLRINQASLPKSLHDYIEYENVIDQLIELENVDPTRVHAKIFCQNLVVMYCGQYVSFGRIIQNKKKTKKSPKEVMDLVIEPSKDKKQGPFTQMNVELGKTTEVLKIIETTRENVLQIEAFDHKEKILSIITWDFNENVEINLKQCVPNPKDSVAYSIVKGMNMKMNYLINQHHVIDLEYNIPTRQKSVNQQLNTSISYISQLKQIGSLYNQRKIYQNQARFLGVEKPAMLFYSLCRIDLLLWWNMVQHGERSDLIMKSCSVENFNIVVDGVTLLHYFAENADMIEKIQFMYNTEKADGKLSEADIAMPLQALNPDHESRTALYRSVQRQSPKSFQCLVEMLIDFPEICVSKMMLKSLCLVFSHESDSVINFFENNIFKPPQMQQDFFLPWQDDLKGAIVFPSHTSVISRKLLIHELSNQGIGASSGSLAPSEIKKYNQDGETKVDSISIRTQRILSKKNITKKILSERFDKEFDNISKGQKQERRVTVEALDMDWIFMGDNAETLLKLLATDANDKCLTKKSIKTFVDFMWTYYQPAIIIKIFIPYFIYMVAFCILSTKTQALLKAADNIVQCSEHHSSEQGYCTPEQISEHRRLKSELYIFNIVTIVLFIFFARIEGSQLIENPKVYFSDPWNWIDTASMILNFIYLCACTYGIMIEEHWSELNYIRISIGSFAVFLMWLKVFYWMRLFQSLAYYVALIQQTLYDSMPFMLMNAIIICAFANYFYVIELNLAATGELDDDGNQKTYFGHWYKSRVSDALVTVYLMGTLGDFDPADFNRGRDRIAAMSMFLLATFLILVVFMNMLIAIMGETFTQVQAKSLEAGIREQVVLISDHCWLLNLKQIFKGKKYLIRVTPSVGEGGESNPFIKQMKILTGNIIKRMNKQEKFFNQKIDKNDVNTRFLFSNQQTVVQQVQRKLKKFQKKYERGYTEEQEEEDMPEELLLKQNALKAKKQMVMSKINQQHGMQQVNQDIIQEVAMAWIMIADQDGDGQINPKEFTEFFSQLDGILITQAEIDMMFKDFDIDGDGELSCEEFARAINHCMFADIQEISDSHSHGHHCDPNLQYPYSMEKMKTQGGTIINQFAQNN